MSARVADDDCRLRHHYAADDRRCHRVVSVTDHLRVVVGLHCVAVYRLSMAFDHLKVFQCAEDEQTGVRTHRVNAGPMHDLDDARISDPM